jgi:hypothetical protein
MTCHDGAVGTVIGYELENRGDRIRVPIRAGFFSSPRRPDRLCANLTSHPVGTGTSFLGG